MRHWRVWLLLAAVALVVVAICALAIWNVVDPQSTQAFQKSFEDAATVVVLWFGLIAAALWTIVHFFLRPVVNFLFPPPKKKRH